MEIKRLTRSVHTQLKNLIKTVKNDVLNPEMLIVLTDDEIDNVFNNDKAVLYGAFEGEKLVAISGLFFDESDYTEIMQLLKIENNKVAEIAECMVLPEARGNDLMFKLNQKLLIEARNLGFEYVIATAHPENVPSKKSLQKLGMKEMVTFKRYGKFLRECFVIKV